MKTRFMTLFFALFMLIPSVWASSLGDVLNALSSSRDDLPLGFIEITSAKNVLKKADKKLKCSPVTNELILEQYDRALFYMQDYYYDEDLDYDKARVAFIKLIGKSLYQSCLYQVEVDSPYYQKIIKTLYVTEDKSAPSLMFEEGIR